MYLNKLQCHQQTSPWNILMISRLNIFKKLTVLLTDKSKVDLNSIKTLKLMEIMIDGLFQVATT